MSDMLLLLGGSLVAVLLLALAARLLKLGGGTIADEAAAKAAAEQLLSGFDADYATLGSDGQAALVHGSDGSVALLKMHGAQIAARHLRPPLVTQTLPEGLRIDSGERRFGAVLLKGVTGAP